jgi:hypothetical protein
LIDDFFTRRSLVKLGISVPISSLSFFEAEYLTFIDQELLRIEADVKNRSASRHKSGG